MLNICRIFSDKNVDELTIFDISNKPIDFKLLAEISSSIFMPLTYGVIFEQLMMPKDFLTLELKKFV